MLYKQNVNKKLSNELFKNPTSEYRGAPFWAWNCDLKEDVLGRQIDALKEMGFGGFQMHSRSGMSLPYLGEEFMSRVKFCVEKAEKEEMLAWLYDEDRWPSGFAGGIVTKDKALRNRIMIFYPEDIIKNDLPREQATTQGEPYFAVAYDIVLDEEGNLISAQQMPRDGKAKGQAWYGYVRTTQVITDWFNNEDYVDVMDEEAIKKFIEVTHEKYKKTVGEHFDKTVPAVFTDEPQFSRKAYKLLNDPFDKEEVIIPWSRFLQEKYTEMYGGDIFDIIPEVIWNLPDGKYSWKRHRFYEFVTECFCRAFSDQCGKWCEENGFAFSGHVTAETFLESQTVGMGEAMRHYRAFHIPGIDILHNFQELLTAKQCQSAVHQYGREGMLCELYGVTNFTFDFRGHKYQGDWLAALGVSVRVPHLSLVSMLGEAKRDFPSSINYQSPWYKEYKYIEDHYARVNTALTRGKPVVNVGIIHPIESYWLVRGPMSQTQELRRGVEQVVSKINSWLLEQHYDFDYISESLLPDLVNENPKAVGKMEYNVIVVPECITLRSTTVEYLEKFRKNGGEVIFIGGCPGYVDAVESDAVNALYEASAVVPFEQQKIAEALEKHATLKINTVSGENASKFLYNMRKDGDDGWLFVANRYPYSPSAWEKDSEGKVLPEEVEITVMSEVYPLEYDTLNGEIKPVRFEHKKGTTVIYKSFYPNDSLLVKLCAGTEQIKDFTAEKNACDEIIADGECRIEELVSYRRHESNVLLLDFFKFAVDGENYDLEEEVLRACKQIRKRLGWKEAIVEQPWVIPDEEPSHYVNLKTVINSEIDYPNPVLALELADICEITWNGEKVTAKRDGWYVDEYIGTVQLPPIRKGENELIVKIPLTRKTDIEAMYLLGNFGVRLEGAVSTIIPPVEKIGFGSITDYGMPFYGGNVDYDINIELKNPGRVQIYAGKYAGALLGVTIDGKRVGNIVFEPYKFTTEELSEGKHTITITCFGNRYNTFGSLHKPKGYQINITPNSWRTEGDEWTYDYELAPTGLLEEPQIRLIK